MERKQKGSIVAAAMRALDREWDMRAELIFLRRAGERIIDGLVLGFEGRGPQLRIEGMELARAVVERLLAYDRTREDSAEITALAKGMRVGLGEAGFMVREEYDVRDYRDMGFLIEAGRRVISGLAEYWVADTSLISGSVLNAIDALEEDRSDRVNAIVQGMVDGLKIRQMISR